MSVQAEPKPMNHQVEFAIGPNADENIIEGVIIAEAGEAKGHGHHWTVEEFEKVVDFAQGRKIPVMFRHWGQLGAQAGYLVNFRLKGRRILADFYLYESADDSPVLPGMRTYILKLAAEDKSAIMFSMSARLNGYYQKDKEGSKRYVWTWDAEQGVWVYPDKKLGKIYADFKELISADLVHQGALTSKLYSTMNPDLNAKLTSVINDPSFIPILEANLDKYPQLVSFFEARNKKSVLEQVKSLFSNEGADPKAMADLQSEITDLKTQLQGAEGSKTQLQTDLEATKSDLTKAQTDLTSAQDKIKDLEAKIAELEKAPAAPPTSVNDPAPTAGLESGSEDAYDLWLKSNPIHQKAMKMYQADHNK